MAKPIQKLLLMVILLAIAFVGLGYRLVNLQVWQHEQILSEAEGRTQRTLLRPARRGDIFDIHRTLLAGSEAVKTVCANPALIGTNHAVASTIIRALAPILQTNETYLWERFQMTVLTNAQGKIVPRQYVRLKQKVSTADWEKIRDTMAKLDFGPGTLDPATSLKSPRLRGETSPTRAQKRYCATVRSKGIFPDEVDDEQRFYPQGVLAAHILGFVSTEERKTNGLLYIENVGRSGVEHMFNNALTGIPGWRKTEIAYARELPVYRDYDIEPRHGQNVVLTIDAGVQHILETELTEAMQKYRPAGACGIIVRPRTGEILALASLPAFDPNRPAAGQLDFGLGTFASSTSLKSQDLGLRTSDFRLESLRNRCISDVYEPGSTFKIVTIAGALNDGLVTLQTELDCEKGYYWFANRRLKDDHPLSVATVEDIVAKSSNIGTAKIGLQLGRDRVFHYTRAFGFGERTQLGLPGEVKGLLAPPEAWSQLQTSRIPIGHGVAVTPLQMVMAMAALANDGRLMQPTLLSRIVDAEGHVVFQSEPRVVRQVVSEAAARTMTTALKRVASPDGTAPHAALEHYTVAGKTGTAEMPGPGGYLPDRYVGSFIGYFPASAPELCIGIVLMDLRPPNYYGGKTAAPIFRKVAERCAKYLAISPDIHEGATVKALTNELSLSN